MNSFTEIINAYGVKTLADGFGTTRSHVFVMRSRDCIPPQYWGTLLLRIPRPVGLERLNFLLLDDLYARRWTKNERGVVAGRYRPAEGLGERS